MEQESVKEVSVAGLHPLGHLLQLGQVLLLQEDEGEKGMGLSGELQGAGTMIGQRLAGGGVTYVFPDGPHPLWTRSPDEDDEGLEAAGPQQLDVLQRRSSQSQGRSEVSELRLVTGSTARLIFGLID